MASISSRALPWVENAEFTAGIVGSKEGRMNREPAIISHFSLSFPQYSPRLTDSRNLILGSSRPSESGVSAFGLPFGRRNWSLFDNLQLFFAFAIHSLSCFHQPVWLWRLLDSKCSTRKVAAAHSLSSDRLCPSVRSSAFPSPLTSSPSLHPWREELYLGYSSDLSELSIQK